MAYEIRVERVFSAAHQLRLPDGSLEPMHGHDWRIRVTVAADKLDGMGCVMDFHKLEAAVDAVVRTWHNTLLNDAAVFRTLNPSAENVVTVIGQGVAKALPEGVWLKRAEVTEAPGCVAAYLPIRPQVHKPYNVDPGPFG